MIGESSASMICFPQAQKARGVLLAPKRQEVLSDEVDSERRRQEDEDFIGEVRDELGL